MNDHPRRGRHRAPGALPVVCTPHRRLSGAAALAAGGLLATVVAGPGGSAIAMSPAATLSAPVTDRAQVLPPLDEPVKALPAAEASEGEHDHFGELGFVGVTPQPQESAPSAPLADDTSGTQQTEATEEAAAPAAEDRVQAPASRSEERASAPEPEQPVTPPSASGAEGAIAWAQANLGLPYQWASSSGGGYDCSGFTTAAFRAAGISLPHQSEAQYHATSRVSLDQIQRGDLLFYSRNGSASGIFHVAIYLGDGQVIHSLRDWSGGFSGSKVNHLNYSPGLMGAGRP